MRWLAVWLLLVPGAAAAGALDAYKADVARHITRANAAHVYGGAPPPMLKSIVVLQITVDAKGRAHARVFRSNGFRELEARALQSVKRASPLPAWSGARGRPVRYLETWLFRADGRFQIRSIAQPQAGVRS